MTNTSRYIAFDGFAEGNFDDLVPALNFLNKFCVQDGILLDVETGDMFFRNAVKQANHIQLQQLMSNGD